jgi:hypothetical protein
MCRVYFDTRVHPPIVRPIEVLMQSIEMRRDIVYTVPSMPAFLRCVRWVLLMSFHDQNGMPIDFPVGMKRKENNNDCPLITEFYMSIDRIKGEGLILGLFMALLLTASNGTFANPVCGDFAYLPQQPYALCAGADTWNFDGITYAKCAKMNGNSISLPQSYPPNNDISSVNAIGISQTDAYIVSTYSPPDPSQYAVYSCNKRGSYAQCDGGICFSNTSGKAFPGLGQVEESEIICSCPITTSSAYQVFGPAECPKTRAEYDQICGAGLNSANNGKHLKIGAPAKRLTVQVMSDCYTQHYESKPVADLARCERPAK